MSALMNPVRFPSAVAFVGSFCLMVLELVAGRIMAPYLGVSLYTWTSVIGIILAGLSAGAYVGGRIADRRASRTVLGGLFLFSGLSTLTALYLLPVVGDLLSGSKFPLPLATFLFSLIGFFPPALFLGCITPVLVKLTLRSLDKTGATVGRISAAGALGSIVGTFATGYVLIAFVGTRLTLVGVALVQIALGIILAGRGPFGRRSPAYLALLVGGTLFLPKQCDTESAYYCIRIAQRPDGYVLRLDHLVHSYVRPRSSDLGYDYEHVFALLLEAQGRRDPRTFFVGGGGYVLPRYLERVKPGATITVAEIDPEVTRVNYTQMELPLKTKVKTVNADARRLLSSLPAEAEFDAIFGDAFNDLSVPYHLTTSEFDRIILAHLAPGGFYAVNVIDNPAQGRFLAAMIRTFQSVFPSVALFPLDPDFTSSRRNTFVLVGSREPLDAARLAEVSPASIPAFEASSTSRALRTSVADGVMTAYAAQGIALSDDYVPVENLLAPIFRAAYQ